MTMRNLQQFRDDPFYSLLEPDFLEPLFFELFFELFLLLLTLSPNSLLKSAIIIDIDISVVGAGVGLGSTTVLVGAAVGLMSTVAGASVGASVSTIVVVGRAVPTEIGQTPSLLGGSTLVYIKNWSDD